MNQPENLSYISLNFKNHSIALPEVEGSHSHTRFLESLLLLVETAK